MLDKTTIDHLEMAESQTNTIIFGISNLIELINSYELQEYLSYIEIKEIREAKELFMSLQQILIHQVNGRNPYEEAEKELKEYMSNA